MSARTPRAAKILPLALVSLGVTGTLLAQQESIWSRLSPFVQTSSRQRVARLEEIKPPVRTRALGQFSWTDLGRTDIDVRDGDTLYTSQLGTGLLRYPDGLGIVIRGNSLVRIEAARQKGVRRILLSEGETEIRFGASSGPVELVAGNRVVKVLSQASTRGESVITTRFAPRERGRNLEIRHQSGASVKVEARDLQSTATPTAPAAELKANTVVAIESAQGQTTARVIASSPPLPEPTATLTPVAAAPAPLVATPAPAAAAATPTAPVVTAKKPPAGKTATAKPAAKPAIVAQVKTRSKTVPAGGSGKKNSPKMGQVSSEGSTQLGANKSTEVINVGLQWGSVPGAKHYAVQVFDDQGKTLVKKQITQPAMEFDLPSIDYTDLQYQVDAALQDGSHVSSGRLSLKVKVTAPVPVLPQPGSNFSIGETTILSWEKVAGALAYEVVITAPGRKPASAQTEVMTENFLLFTPQEAGRYTWRVRATGRKVRGPWSDNQKFETQGN